MSYEQSNFYCINCGQLGLSLQRPKSRRRETWHRKKLYCPHCKLIVNHCECRDDWDVEDFKDAFVRGFFKEEAEESLKECAEENASVTK